MPLGAGAVRGHAGRIVDYGDRSAAGGGVGTGGDQHGAQPGFERHQPGAGGGRSEDRAIQAGGGDRNIEGPGGGGTAQIAGGGAGGIVQGGTARPGGVFAKRPAETVRQSAGRLPGGAPMILGTALFTFV